MAAQCHGLIFMSYFSACGRKAAEGSFLNKYMRIGILTLPLHTNYGGILQAYALQTVLERMGHQVVIIDEPIRQLKTTNKQIVKRIIKKIIGRPTTIFWEKYFYDSYPLFSQNIQTFMNKYLKRLVVESPSELKETDFDAIVVGSDQIWRPKYYEHIENAFLYFAKDWKSLKRIAYAASFGTDEWEYPDEATSKCKECIDKFDAVSVREQSGIKLCKEHLDAEAKLVLDPTMLLTKEDYELIINNTPVQAPEGDLLKYVLDNSDSITELLNHIAKEKNMKPFSVSGKAFTEGQKVENCIQPSIESWLHGFRDAKFVVTDSFHACVFSMIFNKPFCVVGNKTRGMARFHSLLRCFNQEFRLVETISDYMQNEESIKMAPNIDFDQLTIKKESIEFLNMALL